MHFIITDLPVPDWPITATNSAGSTARLRPSSTTVSLKLLARSLSTILIIGLHWKATIVMRRLDSRISTKAETTALVVALPTPAAPPADRKP